MLADIIPNIFNNVNFNDINSIPILIANLIAAALSMTAVLAVIFIIVSGIRYITSQGNPDGVKRAKNGLTNAIVGLIISAAAYLIVSFIARSVLQ
ncbi:MAG TPA: hypothetical protein VLF21_00460 [Candidatus Saccharimonadales bacterium]|nr:hypothetical protein [Candidatus Saccharimonadales bacterium]